MAWWDELKMPRIQKGPLNGRVWVDGAGSLQIDFENGGGITVPEDVMEDGFTVDDGEELDDGA